MVTRRGSWERPGSILDGGLVLGRFRGGCCVLIGRFMNQFLYPSIGWSVSQAIGQWVNSSASQSICHHGYDSQSVNFVNPARYILEVRRELYAAIVVACVIVSTHLDLKHIGMESIWAETVVVVACIIISTPPPPASPPPTLLTLPTGVPRHRCRRREAAARVQPWSRVHPRGHGEGGKAAVSSRTVLAGGVGQRGGEGASSGRGEAGRGRRRRRRKRWRCGASSCVVGRGTVHGAREI